MYLDHLTKFDVGARSSTLEPVKFFVWRGLV